MIGQRFDRLTVIAPAGKTRWKELLWRCQCDCGKTAIVRGKSLRKGTRSCGCLLHDIKPNLQHGGRYTRLYRTWQGMVTRCTNPHAKDFPRYGGAGIHIRWPDFATFQAWALTHGYADDLTIDRIDPCGHYEPSNCRWVTRRENTRHARGTKLSFAIAEEIRTRAANGESRLSLAQEFGVVKSNIDQILKRQIWAS